ASAHSRLARTSRGSLHQPAKSVPESNPSFVDIQHVVRKTAEVTIVEVSGLCPRVVSGISIEIQPDSPRTSNLPDDDDA
ncbi:MAG: hypothetical protein ACK50J_06465, partial [Planctomyces sp.]